MAVLEAVLEANFSVPSRVLYATPHRASARRPYVLRALSKDQSRAYDGTAVRWSALVPKIGRFGTLGAPAPKKIGECTCVHEYPKVV